MVYAVKVPARKQPIVIGKQSTTCFEVLKKTHNLDPTRTMMVGDRYKHTHFKRFCRDCQFYFLLVLAVCNSDDNGQ